MICGNIFGKIGYIAYILDKINVWIVLTFYYYN